MSHLIYKKHDGTSGVSGQLYETKLCSLILFRALHDDDIEEFYIGTNVDGLGELDDICIRFKIKGIEKPAAVFIQAKHRYDVNRRLAANSIDLPKYFDSYLKIRNKFSVNDGDAFFKGTYDDVECAFVFYTNTQDELDKEYNESNYISKINDLISTGDDAFQIPYTEEDVKLLNKMVVHANMGKLATIIADTIRVKGDNYKSLMNNELVQTYHVILSQRVFIFNDLINTEYRMAHINEKLFDTTDSYFQLLGKCLVEALKDKKLGPKATLDSSPLPTTSKPSSHTKSKAFNINNSQHLTNNVEDDAYLIKDLEEQAYSSNSFKLPAEFGNRDLTLRGESSRKEKRLCYLANKLINLLKESNVFEVNDEPFSIVCIDDSFPDKGFLRINGGIAGAVGNLLVFDHQTRLLMFEDEIYLKGYAKILLDKINTEVKELKKYRFDVRVKNFPKLSFDCNEHDKTVVTDFTNRLLICTNQESENEVERTLKGDIGQLQNTRERCNFQMKSDAIFLAYHDAIQKWWLQQTNAEYLTKTCHVFQNSFENFIRDPLLSVATIMYKHKNIKKDVKFVTEVVNLLELDKSFSKITIIVSEVIALSVVKVTQYLNNNDIVILDLNYMLSLPVSDCDRLREELTDNEDKIFILIYILTQASKLNKYIKGILHTLKGKKLIVVTDNASLLDIRKLFAQDIFIIDNKSSLADLTKESQEGILKNTDVIFQGVHVNLGLLVDDDATVFIKGELMDKIMNGESLQVGEPLSNSRYEEIKDFYVSRKLKQKRVFVNNEDDSDDDANIMLKLETFYDIDDHAVLITAEPGMGKSSLLTHLSLTTKVRDPGVWIVRINLLDYSRFFHEWTDSKAVIDILQALRFICIALFKLNVNEKLILHEKNWEIYLKDCCIQTDKEIRCQINVFLHNCSRRKVIFAFDGFDEICPHYETQVIKFLNVLKHYRPRDHRIWITSRTYSKILRSLESVFRVSHHLEPFNTRQQQQFIKTYFKLKLDLNELNEKQIKKIDDFIAFIARSNIERANEDTHVPYISFTNKESPPPLQALYLDMAQHFRDEIKQVLFLPDKEKYVKAWNLNMHARRQCNCKEFMAMPLHIYMVADYFQHQIKHVETDTSWDLNFNTYKMYEQFVETKLRKIRFEEKNQMDLYKPDVQFTFEREKNKFIDEHKKIAAYVMFYEDVDRLFSKTELDEIEKIVSKINSGGEKTGVIYTVINDVPRFVHRTFAEYFAVEYICDILKTDQSDDKLKSLWNFILNTVFQNNLGVLYVLDDKLMMDEELKNKVSEARSKRMILDLLMAQSTGRMETSLNIYHDTYEIKEKVHSSLYKALTENLRNLQSLFLSTLVYITPENVKDLIKIISRTEAIYYAVRIKNMEFTNIVLDTVRREAPSKIHALLNVLQSCCKRWDGDSANANEVLVGNIEKYFKDDVEDILEQGLNDLKQEMEMLRPYYD